MARLNTNTRYLYRSLENYAGKLLSKFPPSLNKVFFVNSGSAATDLAVRLIKAHTGRESFAVLDHAYHGNTQSAVSLSPYKFNRKGGKGKPDQTQIIGLPHGEAGPGLEDFGKLSGIGAFFAEPIPGCAGQVMLNRTYMQTLYREVRAQGGVCVSDEVQTGFGRVGHAFWGYELYDVVPDLVLLGKPMGNGHPMGAVVCTAEIAKSFETGMEFFSSFGGNPVSCEIGLAVLEIIEEEELQENARKVGDYLLNELSDIFLSPGHASRVTRHVSDVRGSGLFLGIEFVKDPATMEPDPVAAREIVYEMKDRGFLLSTDGPHDNVIKFKPPICFTLENARELVENFRSIQDK
jgi:4-aminobutyrate aminotransferase-like enzyme